MTETKFELCYTPKEVARITEEINFLQDKLNKIEKKCLKEQKKFVGIYDDSGRCYNINNESAKFAKSILRIINKEVK